MTTRVKAAVLLKVGQPLEFVDLFLDDPLPGEIVVRTERVGLCHSDLHYLDGSLGIDTPAVLGHEVAGIVESVGDGVTRVAPGDRVVATVTPACGLCAQCLRGRPTQCACVDQVRARSRPKLLDASGHAVSLLGNVGAFAEAFLAHQSAVAVVDPSVPPQVACLLGCCISTGVGAVLHGAHVTPEDTVAVIGCGGVGMAAIQGARLAGARRITAVDMHAAKLDIARRLGATDLVQVGHDRDDSIAAVLNASPAGFSHTFEAVGRPSTAELAFEVLQPGGTATILGLMPEGAMLSISADALVYGDRHLQGAYMGANRFLSDVEMYADHYAHGRLDLDSMVSSVISFDHINAGFEAMSDPTTVRVVVDFSGVAA